MFNIVSISQSKSSKTSDRFGANIDYKLDGVTKAQKAKAFREQTTLVKKKKKVKEATRSANLVVQKTTQVSPAKSSPASTNKPNVASVATVLIPSASGAMTALTATHQPVQPPSSFSTPTGTSVSDIKQQSSKLYYADLPIDDRIAKLAADGCTNEQIAMRLDVTLSTVLKSRKTHRTKSLIHSPRDLFSARLVDFNDAFVTAQSLYNDDPGSEVNYKIMTEFTKTMRELVKDFNDLDDPKELAQQITTQVLRPVIMKTLKSVVDSLNMTLKSTLPFLRDQEKTLLRDGITNGLKNLQDVINSDYNKSVGVLETIFNVDLTEMKLQGKEKRYSDDTESTGGSGV